MKLIKTIVLVRHGTTEYNEKEIWQGRGDSPLNKDGIEKAGLLAGHFKNETLDVIYHSPMTRAVQTAEAIAKNHEVELKAIDGFIEMDLGEFEGKKHAEILANHPDIYRSWAADVDAFIPGGESFNQVFERVKPGVEEVLQSPYSNILIVGHAMVNRAVLGNLLDMDRLASRRFRMRNCAYSKFLVFETPFGRHIIVDAWNVTSHLDQVLQ